MLQELKGSWRTKEQQIITKRGLHILTLYAVYHLEIISWEALTTIQNTNEKSLESLIT